MKRSYLLACCQSITIYNIINLVLFPLVIVTIFYAFTQQLAGDAGNERGISTIRESEPKPDYIVTAELRQRLVEAQTGSEYNRSRRALVANLKDRYEGIDASVTELPAAVEQSRRFSQLMVEWNPIGFWADDLISIAGEPTEMSRHEVMYRFWGAGDGSTKWRFATYNDGRIRGVCVETNITPCASKQGEN